MTNADKVVEEWESHLGKGTDGALHTVVNGVEITISDIKKGSDNGIDWVDIYTGKSRKPAIRIVNPPTLVRDSRGPVVGKETAPDGSERSVRFREDPIQSVAEAVAEVRR